MRLRMSSLAVLTSLVLLAATELVVAQIMGPDCNVTMDWSPQCLRRMLGTELERQYSWSNYLSNCPDRLTPLPFPYTVPLGTRVPQWALVDHTLEENWNATKAGIDTPETEPGSPIGPSGSTSPIPNGDDFLEWTEHWHNRGQCQAIVGGVAALATIGALIYFLRKRRRSQVLSAVVDDVAPPLSQEPPPLSAGEESDETYVPKKPVAPLKLYDPNDPGTFPEYQRVSTSVQVVRVSVAPKDGSLNGNTLTTMPAAFTPGYHGLPTV
ncbi:hypothetical protein EDB86DRAFT_2825079 [Lactarius hatsudake]|nr:hypothetical protein EDB86DRAFT_2825079 [Lactarius hatsudake]